VHDTLDSSIIAILLQAYLSAVVLSWLAHAILPGHDATEDAPQPAPATDRPAMRALANAAILLGAMTLCLTNNALSVALVLPITVASVLLQFDFATSVRSALSTVAVNLLSGVLASLAFAFVELRPSLPFLFLTIFLVGLILGGRRPVVPRCMLERSRHSSFCSDLAYRRCPRRPQSRSRPGSATSCWRSGTLCA
jgi:hypothetical protein